ncbi:MAG TPA: SDR family NAD(P)-dependent oxidoreductase [Candidatus Dormibacteraeota bacterium]|nr:SDR family NAD(P)-dependent oxidoreductase [Candidatus Dormibacteraeota bacterium]
MSVAGKRILVTGADGFIGSHLVERLVADGALVRALCYYTSNGTHGWLDGVAATPPGAMELRLGDVRDAELMADMCAGVDIVLHLAALIAIPYSYQAPRSYVDTNVVGTLNVLEAARRHGVERFVHTSTSEVYGTPASVPISEGHALHGQSPYSASKIGADMLCEAWSRAFELPVVVLRPFNTYGPRQSARAIIPTILGQLLSGVRPLRLGSLEPRRDFTFVSDTVDGFVRAATTDLEAGQVIQLGTGHSVSMSELVQRAVSATGVEDPVEVVLDDLRVRPARSEVEVLQSDPSRAAQLLGWHPTVDLDRGLRIVAEWLRPRVDPAFAAQYRR